MQVEVGNGFNFNVGDGQSMAMRKQIEYGGYIRNILGLLKIIHYLLLDDRTWS